MLGRIVGIFVLLLATALSIMEADAACTVPNTLANGTTADATPVMGNFTSIAGCAAPLASPSFTGTITASGLISSTATTTSFATSANTGLQYSGSGSDTSGVGVSLLMVNGAGNSGAALRRTTGNALAFDFYNAGWVQKAQLDQSGNLTIAGTYSPSDQRLKVNVQPLAAVSGLGLISRLRPVSYNWADTSRGTELQMGLVAQEVQKAVPTLVANSGIISKSTPDGMLAVNYSGLITPIVLAIQQLDERTRAIANGVRQGATETTRLSSDSEMAQLMGLIKSLRDASDRQRAEIQSLRQEILAVRRNVSLQTASNPVSDAMTK